MINPLNVPSPFQSLVDMAFPLLAPTPKQRPVVPAALLVTEPIAVNFSQGKHHVHMRVTPIPLAVGVVDSEIRDHPARDELVADEASNQIKLLVSSEFMRQRKLDLSTKLGVPALLGALNGIPKCFSVQHPARCLPRGHDLLVHDTMPPFIVMKQSSLGVEYATAGTVRGSGSGRAAITSRNQLCRKTINRHLLLTFDMRSSKHMCWRWGVGRRVTSPFRP